jgi:hypothetical protein
MLVNLTHIRSKGAMHIKQILRERCGIVPVTAYKNSLRGSNCKLTIT